MKNRFLSLFILALVTVTLTACGGQENTTATQEWSSESQPETTPGNESTEKDSTKDETDEEEGEQAVKSSSDLSAGGWVLDTEASTMTWTGSKVVGSAHSGTVEIKEGALKIDESGATTGEFVIDMTTIKDEKGDATLEGHLKNDDFFAVDKFPESKLVIKSITGQGGDYTVIADLTIRGITNEISFEAATDGAAEKMNVQAEFAIDRTKWDIKFDSSSFFQNLGDNAIKDEMEFKLDLVFSPQEV